MKGKNTNTPVSDQGNDQKINSKDTKRGFKKNGSNGKDGSQNPGYTSKAARACQAYGVRSTAPSKHNDWEWYAGNKELLSQAVAISFGDALGSDIFDTDVSSVSGVMQVAFVPALGKSSVSGTTDSEADNAINIVARRIMAIIRANNSRNAGYTPSDVMMVEEAIKSIILMYLVGVRAYGTMSSFSPVNRYTPEILIKAMGFSYDSLRDNMNNFLSSLNQRILELTQYAVPNVFPVLQRQMFLCGNYFKDTLSNKDQFYVFMPKCLYKYSAFSNEKGGELIPVELTQDKDSEVMPMTVETYFQKFDELIRGIRGDTDVWDINGDIIQAFGEKNVVTLAPITSTFQVVPKTVKEANIRDQLSNLTMFGEVHYGNITQEDDIIHQDLGWDPEFTRNLPRRRYFNMVESTKPEDIIVATRFMASPETYGTEVPVFIRIFGSNNRVFTNDGVIYWTTTSTGYDPTGSEMTLRAEDLYYLIARSEFKYAPHVLITHLDGDASPTFVGYVGRTDIPTYITSDVLAKQHNAAVFSEYGISGDSIKSPEVKN